MRTFFWATLCSLTLLHSACEAADQPAQNALSAVLQPIWKIGHVQIDDDGAIWTIDPKFNLLRWDGKEWSTLRALGQPQSVVLLPGLDGVMIVHADYGTLLYHRDQLVATGRLYQLLEDQTAFLSAAFAPDRRKSVEYRYLKNLVGGRDGSFWIEQGGTLQVMAGNRWHDATDPLMAAGSPLGVTHFVAAIGDGSRMYVTDADTNKSGLSMIGQMRAGKLFFDQAQAIEFDSEPPRSIRDRDGALWVSHKSGVTVVTYDAASGKVTERTQSGRARLLDQAGNVWVNEIQNGTPTRFTLWRDGKAGRNLEIPAFTATTLFFSDKPGSVYALTKNGLQHLVADVPDFREYRLGTLHSLGDVKGLPIVQTYSSLGYLVVSTSRPGNSPESSLWLLKLPQDDK